MKIKTNFEILWHNIKRVCSNFISIFTHFDNFLFCCKYPFMKARNVWTNKFVGYKYTEYDAIPEGWRKAFGPQLLEELKQAIKKDKQSLRWEQIKEKYGELRLYASCGNNAQDVLCKYELMSMGYCIECGKPARYCTHGWIEYYCEDCYDSLMKKDDEYKQQCRLTKSDIPSLIQYANNEDIKIDLKEQYGIDFEELWGIKENE